MTETSGPRGRISLIRAVDRGELDLLSPGFVHQMSECLDCRACAAVCPSGVQYGNLVEAARAQIASAQDERRSAVSRAARGLLLRALFGRLWLMRFAAFLLRIVQATGLQGLVERIVPAASFSPEISQRFFTPRDQRFSAHGAARYSVFLHVGCVMHVAFTPWHEATIRMLRRSGCSVVVPSGQGCCGAIAVHAGEETFGVELAKRNIAAFEDSGADYYIVNAAGCGSALKEYGHLLRGDTAWAARAAAFSSRVRDVLEFLDEIGIAPPDKPRAETVTYQDACHLAHAQRITAAPRRLLLQIPELRLVEMAESSICCGSAGIYNLTQPEMAARLGERKAAHVEETGAATVATSNPGCAMQVQAHVRKRGKDARVAHVVELLDEAYEN